MYGSLYNPYAPVSEESLEVHDASGGRSVPRLQVKKALEPDGVVARRCAAEEGSAWIDQGFRHVRLSIHPVVHEARHASLC